jgi:hypothetical protein
MRMTLLGYCSAAWAVVLSASSAPAMAVSAVFKIVLVVVGNGRLCMRPLFNA